MKKKIAVLTSGWALDFVTSMLEGMKEAAAGCNTDLYVFLAYKFYEPNGDPNTTGFAVYDLINYQDYDGIIITPNFFNDDERAEAERKKILKSGVPAVSINKPMEGLSFISAINHDVYRDLISHLIEKHNCKNLAFIGGPFNESGAKSNYEAFLQALESHNLPAKKEQIFIHGDWSYNWAYDVAQKLLEDPEKIPDGIVCINDLAAMAVERVAAEKNISIPQELKVIGFDNIELASTIIPSITTVTSDGDRMGAEAVKVILEGIKEPVVRTVKARPIYRQSCGCQSSVSETQVKFSQRFHGELEDSQRFTSHLRHLEDIFIRHETMDELCKHLQYYFAYRHNFEGYDMAILLNEDVARELEKGVESKNAGPVYGKKMRTLVNLVDGNAVPCKTIQTRDLIPESLKTEENALYLFLPVFNQKIVHGYYVSRNYTGLLKNKNAYNWTRNFGAIIEKFRQTSAYRSMSQQLLLLSTQDSLSGLLNRTGLDIYAQKLFEENNSQNKATEIIFADINNMKLINDKHGHIYGDIAVKTVAETIREVIPPGYLSIRYGGDEFVIIGQRKGKINYSEKIQTDLEKRSNKMSLPFKLTVSLGQKIFKAGKETSLDQAIREVDQIMYQQKILFHKSKK